MSDSQPAVPAAPVGDDVALAIRGLVKIYGNLVAVADLSLDIPTGSSMESSVLTVPERPRR